MTKEEFEKSISFQIEYFYQLLSLGFDVIKLDGKNLMITEKNLIVNGKPSFYFTSGCSDLFIYLPNQWCSIVEVIKKIENLRELKNRN